MGGISVYSDLAWPKAPGDRPWVAVNMIATLDGKTVSGENHAPINLGSATDKATLRSIENAASGIMIGRATLEDTPGLWFPAHVNRYVVSAKTAIETDGRFFTDAPDEAWIVTTKQNAKAQSWPHVLACGEAEIDFNLLLSKLRKDHDLKCLLVEGGSELNSAFFEADLVDEFFLTLAPLIKLGRDVPTVAGGEPLPASDLKRFELASNIAVGDELFLRYRRKRNAR